MKMENESSDSDVSAFVSVNSTNGILIHHVEHLCEILVETFQILDLTCQQLFEKRSKAVEGNTVEKFRTVGIQTDLQTFPTLCTRKTQTVSKCPKESSNESSRLNNMELQAFKRKEGKAITRCEKSLAKIKSRLKNLQNTSVGCMETCDWKLLAAKENILRQMWELGSSGTEDRLRKISSNYKKVFSHYRRLRKRCSRMSQAGFKLQTQPRKRTEKFNSRKLRHAVKKLENNYKVMMSCIGLQLDSTIEFLSAFFDTQQNLEKNETNSSARQIYDSICTKLVWIQSCMKFFHNIVIQNKSESSNE